MNVTGSLSNWVSPTSVLGLETLDRGSFIDPGGLDEEIGDVCVTLFSVRDGALQNAAQKIGAASLGKIESCDRLFDAFATNHVRDQTSLAR